MQRSCIFNNRQQGGHYMRRAAAILALLMMGVLTGCNTMEGMGRDLERGGEKIQDSAKGTKEKI
jgi:entericidin B